MKFEEKGKVGKYYQRNSAKEIANYGIKITQGYLTSTYLYN
jgi:hypothetical protein